MSNMSSTFWAPDADVDATPVSPVTGFSGLTQQSGGFRSRFGAMGDGAGWTATRTGPGMNAGPTDHLEPEPEIDLVEQASQQGFVAGFQEGERITREAAEADDSVRRDLIAAIGQLGGVGEGALASLLSHSVLRLVTQIVGEVPVDEARLAERCAAIAAHIDPDDGKAVLEVSPLDLPLIPTDGLGVALVPNPQLSRGSVRLATSDGWIEDGPDVRLDRLKAMMDDMEGRL